MKQVPKRILFFDLPTFPKGILPLSLPALAAALGNELEIELIDLNIQDYKNIHFFKKNQPPDYCGLKVSAQNFDFACQFTLFLKKKLPHIQVFWGGEFPSLMPDECLKHCDAVVCGPVEPIATELVADLKTKQLKTLYIGHKIFDLSKNHPPRFDLVQDLDKYYSFMGLPLETSRGCTQRCTFCMVHTMQKNYHIKSVETLQKELHLYAGHFINIIDYNLGVDVQHVINVSKAIEASDALGWMGEMCLEMLDNDDLLAAMSKSRCRMIYCGLESIEEEALRSINKARTNQLANYQRIIRKVQSYGIHIASGLILGIKGTNEKTFEKTAAFFAKMGIIYTKLTFLTYNPGTKVKKSMERVGSYLTEDIGKYDGNHLTFVPNGISPTVIYEGAAYYIHTFYSLAAIVKRSLTVNKGVWANLEYILFNLGYREAYQAWLQENVLTETGGHFKKLLHQSFRKSWSIQLIEKGLKKVRQVRFLKSKRAVIQPHVFPITPLSKASMNTNLPKKKVAATSSNLTKR